MKAFIPNEFIPNDPKVGHNQKIQSDLAAQKAQGNWLLLFQSPHHVEIPEYFNSDIYPH